MDGTNTNKVSESYVYSWKGQRQMRAFCSTSPCYDALWSPSHDDSVHPLIKHHPQKSTIKTPHAPLQALYFPQTPSSPQSKPTHHHFSFNLTNTPTNKMCKRLKIYFSPCGHCIIDHERCEDFEFGDCRRERDEDVDPDPGEQCPICEEQAYERENSCERGGMQERGNAGGRWWRWLMCMGRVVEGVEEGFFSLAGYQLGLEVMYMLHWEQFAYIISQWKADGELITYWCPC